MAYEQRKNTYGGQDLYVSFIRPDSTWSKPLNLGSTVNTKGIETAPFLAPDDSTLYYTSNGLPGYGGGDIYVTYRLDNTWQNWSKPKNLGPKVNTETDQSFLEVVNNKIYFSSEDNLDGNLDLYTLVPDKTLAVQPSVTKEVSGKIDNSPSPIVNSDQSLSTIFFDFNKYEIKTNSINELTRLANLLLESPYTQLEISGHTDAIGSEDYNYVLGQKRADAVSNYFISKFNITENRLIVKNYGETKPIADNNTEEGRQLNRRVEMTFKNKLLVTN